MKIIFKEPQITKDILLVKIDFQKNSTDLSQAVDEIVKEGNTKTLYLKCEEKINLRKFILLIRSIVQKSKSIKAKKLCLDFNDFSKLLPILSSKEKILNYNDTNSAYAEFVSLEDLSEIIGFQLIYANYEFTQYKTKKENNFLEEIYILNTNLETEKSISKGTKIAEEVNKARDLANTPGGDMTPSILALKAKEAVKNLPVKVSILGEKEMKKLKMEAILSVGRGSDEESKFIIMEYWGSPQTKLKEKPIVLVGKGVTFDSGGINLKPSNSILGMNMDMSGGGAVIHTISLIAKMKIKKNIIALIPSVENFISGKSYRPGDVIYSMSGKTIEILNTDAEGRVIMADALTYALKYKPSLIIDVATLTGAAVVALGEKMSALFTEDEKIVSTFQKIGEKTGEYFWPLPMGEEYENEIKGSLGDFTNVHNKDSRYGGASYAAIFLKQFTQNNNWLHIDIAPRMTSTAGDNLAIGSTGTPIYSIYKFIEENNR
jgi:leucyl aminopeptidase